MTKRSEDRDSCYTAESNYGRPESCQTALSYSPNDSGANTGYGNQRSSVENKLIAMRLTRARLWIVCDLLSALHSDELMPEGQSSRLDKHWKKAWLSEVQTPLNAMITSVDCIADTDMTQSYQAMSGDIKKTREQDSKRLTKAIRDVLQTKAESTPICALRDRIMAVRLLRTTLLVIGELCGDLGQDFKIPMNFTGENSLLNQDAKVSQGKSPNKLENMSLTEDLKDNLKRMQAHVASKVHNLHSEESDRYDQRLGVKSVAEWCDADAEEVEKTILVPFADECNRWDIARPRCLFDRTIENVCLERLQMRAAS